ncbi:MAG: phosphoglycolate phosphatase [Herbaspirillum sp.]
MSSQLSAIRQQTTTVDWSGIRAVILDMDGTMLDTAGDFQAAINLMCAEFNFPPLTLATILGFVGKGSEHLIECVLAVNLDRAGVTQHFSAALAAYQRHYAGINGQHVSVYPGVVAGLDAFCAQGLRLACVTNKPIRFARELLVQMKLDAYFDVVYGGDSLPTKKPHPGPLLRVCADFGLQPTQVLAIGDSSNDALAARAAGCRVLNVPYGYNHGQSVQELDSDGIVSTLQDAAALITNRTTD